MSKGTYIAIEGIPGAGKSTLIQMLARELQAANTPVLTLSAKDKPQNLTAQTIDRIIEDPRYPLTTQAEVLLYNAVRAQSIDTIRTSVEAGVTCIGDQSYLSVLVEEYYGRGTIADYTAADEIIRFATGALQPDLVIVLDTPVNTARNRLPKGASPDFTEAQLERVRAGYLWEAKQRNIPVVYASDPIESVFEHVKSYVGNIVSALKPQQEASESKREVASVAEVLAAHPVSSKTSEIPPTTEPPLATNTSQSTQPSARVSEQSYPFNLGRGSMLFEAHLNQLQIPYTTLPRRLDQKSRGGRRPYYIPEGLSDKLKSNYTRTLDQILETRAQLIADLTTYIRSTSNVPKNQQTNRWQAATKAQARDVLEALLPLATTSVIETPTLPKAIQDIVIELQSSNLSEARKAGQHFLQNALKTIPASTRQSLTDTVSRSVSHRRQANSAIAELANELLPSSYATSSQEITLSGHAPRNELDIVAPMLYEHGDLPLRELEQTVSALSYEQKLAIFKAYLEAPTPGRALEEVTYNFDIVSDYQSFHTLVKQGKAARLSWQLVTPRIGYETPGLVEQAGLSDAFAQCFDLSLLLYSELQAAGHHTEAQYASLLGHKLRWRATYSAHALFRLYAQAARGTTVHKNLLDAMYVTIEEVHPLFAEVLRPIPQATLSTPATNKA